MTVLGVMPHLAHQALLAQGRNDAVGVHAADGPHALARNRLVVSNNGQGLEGRLREAPLIPREHVVGDLVVEGRVREEAPPSSDLAQLEATVCVCILGREFRKRRGNVTRRGARGLCQVCCRDGVIGHEEQGLQEPLERAVLKPLETCHHASFPVSSACATSSSPAPKTSPKPSSSRSCSPTPCSSSS